MIGAQAAGLARCQPRRGSSAHIAPDVAPVATIATSQKTATKA